MAKQYQAFQFKNFSVSHQNSAMKVGTDSVLLGCLAVNEKASHALDIGTGSGLLALMMAQQSNAQITAVEINQQACIDAHLNFENSIWSDRIQLNNESIQSFANKSMANCFDWILSNPPYYTQSENYNITQHDRKIARQSTELPLTELIQSIAFLLAFNGLAGIVLPCSVALELQPLLFANGLFVSQEISIHAFKDKPANRIIWCLQKNPVQTITKQIVIYETPNQYTEAYYQLTQSFYLWLDRT